MSVFLHSSMTGSFHFFLYKTGRSIPIANQRTVTAFHQEGYEAVVDWYASAAQENMETMAEEMGADSIMTCSLREYGVMIFFTDPTNAPVYLKEDLKYIMMLFHMCIQFPYEKIEYSFFLKQKMKRLSPLRRTPSAQPNS